jgi:DNA-binding CsgD family transcriptional regulator
MYRILNGSVLVTALVEEGQLDAAVETLVLLDSEAESGYVTGAVLRWPADACGLDRTNRRRAGDFERRRRPDASVGHLARVSSRGGQKLRSPTSRSAITTRRAASQKEELELAVAFGAPRTLGVAKRAAGVVAGGVRGELLLREAIDVFDDGDARLERARALADLGAMLRRRNRRTEARELLREGLDAAHRAGARPLAEQAETELRATGARPRRVVLSGLDSLTASERRIAELASQGLSNREIAQMLFITARTVEGHLTSVFRKLQLDSRNELPTALAGGAPVPA